MSRSIFTFNKKLRRLIRKTVKGNISESDFLIVMYANIDTVMQATIGHYTDPNQRRKILQDIKGYHNAHTQVLQMLELMYGNDDNDVIV